MSFPSAKFPVASNGGRHNPSRIICAMINPRMFPTPLCNSLNTVASSLRAVYSFNTLHLPLLFLSSRKRTNVFMLYAIISNWSLTQLANDTNALLSFGFWWVHWQVSEAFRIISPGLAPTAVPAFSASASCYLTDWPVILLKCTSPRLIPKKLFSQPVVDNFEQYGAESKL